MRIFLTGGTGSLGQAILARADRDRWPADFTIFSRDEVKQGQLRPRYPQHRFVLGDIRDEAWLTVAMKDHDMVIHTAAYKQVPQAEINAAEAIETNVLGSRNVARVAQVVGVNRVIGISTDKACAPVSCYGQTKALMEKLFAQACLWGGGTQYNCVRYGNVLGSRESVLPMFQRQLAEKGEVTVTDPLMTRFWLTIDQAVDLVSLATQERERGTVLVPKAEASTIGTLVEALGARPDQIRVIGVRPGERLHERMIHGGEASSVEDDGDIFRVWPAYSNHRGNVTAGFEYSSDAARQLTVTELQEMINHAGH